jgi:predicted outer membrane repeat protein
MKRPAGGVLSVVMKCVRSMRAQWLLLALITGFASRGMAQCDYQVTSLADSGAGTLRAGIATAPTTTDICFSVQGTITLQSSLQITEPVTITGSNGVTISGNNSVGIFVINIAGEYESSPLVTISGLTLSGGNATAGNNIYGGAIWVQVGSTTLSNMTITGNTAVSGGALYTEDTVIIQNSTISNNTATTGVGGAIANENNDGTLTIQNTTISGNTSSAGSGGALDNGGTTQVTGGTFQGNSADYGGAIDNEYYATLTISGGTTFNSNIATINGGAIENYGTANITAALFTANQAQGDSDSVGCGGAICNESTLTVTESTFVANATTGSGGGIESDSSTTITLQDDTIYGNTADYTGSGLDIEQSSSTPIVENTVIAGNTAIQGQTNPDCFGCAAATQGGDLIGGTANLGPLANNGGPTLTMMPLPAGNLIGLGVPADTSDATDQRGFSRLSAGAIDIGAVQSHYSSVSFLTQPSNTLINQPITPAAAVQVIEVDGETTNYPQGVPVTLSLIPPQGVNATLSGTLTQGPTVTNGVTAAVFPGLSVNTAGSFQLFATDAVQGNSGSADPAYLATSSAFQITQPTVVTLQWQPAPVTYGPLPASELNATATVNGAPGTGTFVYTFVSSGATISVGQIYPVNSYSVQVAFTPTSSATTYTMQTTLQISRAVPVLSWTTPAPIYTSTALSATQLDATATGVTGAPLPGTFTYTPVAGSKLTAGQHTLSTSFTPTDAIDYATATAQVTIQVNAVTASTAVIQISANPITFGQSETFTAVVTGTDGNPLSGGTAAFTVDSVAIGSVSVVNGLASVTDATLTGGTHQVGLTYTNAALTLSGNTTLTVNRASPMLTWPTPASINTSTALSATQLDATAKGVTGASLPGATVYNPAAGSMLTAGTDTLSVIFTPTDTVDYKTATAQVTITVGYTPLSISVAAPTSVALSTNPTTVAITGSGFTSTTVAELNGTALPTTVSSATALTASLAPSFLGAVGTYHLTVYDSVSKLTSNALTFTVTAPAADLTVSVPSQPTSADQPVIGLVLNTAYPSALAGAMTLSFTPSSSNGVDDPAVQFATGGRTFSFTVPAGSTTTPQVALQTGTVAGTINVTLSLTADGVDVTPTGVSPITLVIAPGAPVVTSVTFTNNGTGQLTVVVNGFSNTRDMSGADFVFTGTGASALGSSTASVTTTSLFTPWYASATSDAYGSEFTYTQNFQLSQPDSGITGVSVTLTNSIGTSESVSSQ